MEANEMKKILSILMAAAMLMTLCAFGISAADEPTMTVSTASAERGQTASVDVVVSGNPGMNAAVLKPVYYTAALELVSMEFNDIDFRGNVEYGVKAVWATSADNSANGKFLTLNFKVLDEAKAGKTEVTLENVDGYLKTGSVSNRAEESINYKVVAGAVNVIDPNVPMMNVSTVYGLPGDTVTVSVSLVNNPGIRAAALKPVYDNTVLELTGMEFKFSGNTEYGVKAVWAASADNASNGEFLTMTFKVLDGAEGSTVVSVAYEEGDICNSNEEDVNFVVNAGSVIFDTEPTAEPEPDTTVPEPDDTTTAAPSTTAGTEPTNPTAPQTADAGIAVAAVALAAAACFVAVKKRK